MAALNDLRKMSTTEINKVKKDELIQAILTSPQSTTANRDDLLLSEMRAIRKGQGDIVSSLNGLKAGYDQLRKDKDKIEADVIGLKETVESQGKIIEKQQIYLEQLDAKERGKNIIVTGIPEDENWKGKDSDEGKLTVIFQQMGIDDDTENMTWKRIGKKAEDKCRPILVIVTSMQKRNHIVSQAPKLKEDGQTQSIRVKKDKSPAARAEWKRLFDVEALEKAKPENAGRKIEVDKKNRTVLCDEIVIDSWKPSAFQ